MGRRGRIVGVLVVVAIIAGAVLLVRHRNGQSGDEQVQTALVTRGELRSTVGGTGSLVPSRQVDVSFVNSGTVSQVLVEPGSTVAEGDPLAVLETRSLESEVATSRASLASARSSLAIARAELADLEAGPTAYEVASAELSLEQAKDSLWGTQSSRDGICGRVARGQGQEYECNSQEASVLRAEGSVRQAELELEQVLAGPTDIELASARDKVASAESGVASAEAQVEEAELRLVQATITAPISGTVTAVNVSAGAASGTGVAVQVSDLDALDVEIRLDETDVADVEVGQEAVVTLDAFPDTELTGQVRDISLVAETESGVVLYPVTVSLAADDVPARPGMTADVEIIVASVADALIVPLRAVISGPNDTSVVMRLASAQVADDGAQPEVTAVAPAARSTRPWPGAADGEFPEGARMAFGTPGAWGARSRAAAAAAATGGGSPVGVPVEIGLTTDSQAQVLSGLSEGDTVVVQASGSSSGFTGPEGARIGGMGGVFIGR